MIAYPTTLPVAADPVAPLPVPANGAPSPPGTFVPNILLVDDRPDKLLALEAILARLNANLVKARSGKEALRLLLQQDFAVILLDVSMPGMDGFETAAMIRQRPRTEHTPIIFITAIGNTRDHIAQGYSLRAVDYLNTPIVPDVLRTKVSVFVDLHRQTELIRQQSQQVNELNRALEERIRALTSANQELEAFNYSIAHDLRAPLRSMGGFARALVEDESSAMSESGRDYARRILRSAEYMDKLLLGMLTYSRLARSELPPHVVDLEEITAETLALVEREVRERSVKVEILSPLGRVLAHPVTMRQILANLIGNSLKFTAPDRAPLLRLFTTRAPGFVRLWIEDNGIGIAPQFHERIFGLFQRLHDSQTYPGTGIGLALVRKGAERMGGRAGVESELGQGSRFWVELPASE
jgi:two-component system sensor histidine kinase/response regulator